VLTNHNAINYTVTLLFFFFFHIKGQANVIEQSPDIESSGPVDVDDLQLVYFNEDDKKDTRPPLNPNVSGGMSMSSFISNMAHSASSSALFGNGPTSINNSSSANIYVRFLQSRE
jgi:hypothetical protein